GTYTATFTAGTTAGSTVITGTLDGVAIGDSAVISLRPTQASPGASTIAADSSSLVADGESTSLITVPAGDRTARGVSAAAVRLRQPAHAAAARAPVPADGTYTAACTAGTTAGSAVITGTLDGVAIGDSAVITLRPTQASPGASTISADSSSLVAD